MSGRNPEQETFHSKRILFCPYCGTELDNGARFCKHCGSPIDRPKASTFKTREQEYAGKMIKCPACGEDIPSFTAICPSCGHEINSATVSPALEGFIAAINECDARIADSPKVNHPKKGWQSWKTGMRVFWFFLNIYTLAIPLVIYLTLPMIKPLFRGNVSPELTATEQRKAALIENFAFPNDRESLLEALLFTKSKTAFLVSEKLDEKTIYWFHLWYTKALQLYQKTNLLLANDPIAGAAYQEILSNKKGIDQKIQKRAAAGAGIILVYFAFIVFAAVSTGA